MMMVMMVMQVGASSCSLADEAAGSGVRDDQRLLHDDGGDAVSLSSAGVPAKEEGRISGSGSGRAYPVFIEERGLQPHVKFVYSPLVVSPCPNSPRIESVVNLAPSCCSWTYVICIRRQ